MNAWSVRSKRRDQYHRDNRETNDKTKPFILVLLIIATAKCQCSEQSIYLYARAV